MSRITFAAWDPALKSLERECLDIVYSVVLLVVLCVRDTVLCCCKNRLLRIFEFQVSFENIFKLELEFLILKEIDIFIFLYDRKRHFSTCTEAPIIGLTDLRGWFYKLTLSSLLPFHPSVRPCRVFWPFLQNGSKDLPNALHDCRGQWGTLFEPDSFSEKILNNES